MNLSLFAEPLGRLLQIVYGVVGNYGISIIIFTILVKLVMIPLTLKQTKSMKNMQEIQPKIKEIQKKYQNDKEKMNEKVMELYKEHNVNPFGGCLPLLIQFPIIIGLFTVLRQPENYGFAREIVEASFLWMPSLSAPDPWILPVLAGATTYLSSKTMSATKGGGAQQEGMQKMMLYFFPIMIMWWGRSFPAGLTLYWVVSNLFQTGQQLAINRPSALLPNKGSEAK
jgi:YidC/Oxa1 family membrane protein insertase